MSSTPSVPAVRAWAKLVRVHQLLLAAVERDLKTAGQPPLAWYDVLLELTRAPEGRLRPFELERRMLLAQYNLSRLLDRLERNGLVAREPCREDGRGQWVVLMAAGRERQRAMWPIYANSIQNHVGAKLADADADLLTELLDRVTPEDPASTPEGELA
ncbi:MAG TPA: helix-turn-helix domain-containing protein [Geminicoccaceae bacterium]|nr:helix-turn-helix domain-containing protein [Geminicoccaceae bacterium]